MAQATATSAVSAPPRTAAGRPALPDNQNLLYVLDGYGGVHPVGSAPDLAITGYWSGWDIARGLAMLPDGSAGIVLDGYGGLHPVGSGMPFPSLTAYWNGWDIARSVVFAPWATKTSPQGWVLDGWGGIHPFGGAPWIAETAYWQGWDIARQIVITPNSTQSSIGGYVLDGWGGLHSFGNAPAASPTAYWQGWDIARGVALVAGSSTPGGYVLDGWGGIHAFGSAPALSTSAYWQGWDIARSVVTWTAGAGGWVLDGWGGVHPFGNATAVSPTAYWQGWDIARGAAGAGSGGNGRKPPPPPVRHRVVVSLSAQHLWAYDNGQLVLETDVTTGRPELPTPTGTYHIFYKASPYEMISPWPPSSPYYYPPTHIAYAMEFIEGGYFLHDAPWRSWFGPGSQYYGDGTHGCVNLPGGQGWGPIYALWNWAQIGDEVVVQN